MRFSRSLLPTLYLVLCALGALGFDWPVEDPVLMSTFGQRRQGCFFAGIDLGGGEQPVFPIADGELVFHGSEEGRFHSLKRGNGTFVVLQHEGRIRSVYSHLGRDSARTDARLFTARPERIAAEVLEKSILNKIEDPAGKEAVLEGFQREGEAYTLRPGIGADRRKRIWMILSDVGFIRTVGFSGDTGLSEGTHVSLMIIDHEEGTILNPIKKDKPPLRPVFQAGSGDADGRSRGPVIEAVYLKRGREIIELTGGMSTPSGTVEILARIYDRSDALSFSRNLAPYRLYLSDTGRSVSTLVFDALREGDGRLVLAHTDLNCDDIYYDDWIYRLGTLNLVQGGGRIQIRAEDFLGRESSVEIPVRVSSEKDE